MLITIQTSWAKATIEQKRDMLKLMLDAVYVDTDEWKILSIQPNPDFLDLFRHTGLVEHEGRFSL